MYDHTNYGRYDQVQFISSFRYLQWQIHILVVFDIKKRYRKLLCYKIYDGLSPARVTISSSMVRKLERWTHCVSLNIEDIEKFAVNCVTCFPLSREHYTPLNFVTPHWDIGWAVELQSSSDEMYRDFTGIVWISIFVTQTAFARKFLAIVDHSNKEQKALLKTHFLGLLSEWYIYCVVLCVYDSQDVLK